MKILKWLSISDRFIKKYLDQKLAQFGINSSQYMYLMKVCKYPGILQDSFLESFYVHPSNIVRMITTLEKKEFLTRVPYENDKRTWRLYPTQKALDIADKIYEICNEAETLLTAKLSPDEQNSLSNTLYIVGKQIANELNIERKEDEFDE